MSHFSRTVQYHGNGNVSNQNTLYYKVGSVEFSSRSRVGLGRRPVLGALAMRLASGTAMPSQTSVSFEAMLTTTVCGRT